MPIEDGVIGADRRARQAPVELAAPAATLGIAAVCWVLAFRRMSGMAMGVATQLGSFGSFVLLWLLMMAAMMLPGAVAAVVRCARTSRPATAVSLFIGGYLGVWTLVGLAVFAMYRPHGTVAAGIIAIVAGSYELSPLKQRCRQRCRDNLGSGLEFGRYCVGSCGGLMLLLIGLSDMSLAWMAVVTLLVAAQKLLPRKAALDVPLALAMVGLGVLIIVAPSTVPGLMPAM